jgi:hypothetical protein
VDLLHPANLIMAALGLGLLVLKVWALVDCVTRQEAAFALHNKLTKTAWLAILAVAAACELFFGSLSIFGIAGTVAAIVYLVDVRPAVSGKAY